jgi:hypothetical protein
MTSEFSPPGLGLSLAADGTVTAVFDQVAIYAGLAPGDVVLTVNPDRFDPNYIDAWVRRQGGAAELVHLWLGQAGPDFGIESPPPDCPPRFVPLYGDRRQRRARPASAASRSRSRDVAINGRASYSAEEIDRRHRVAWAEVERLRSAAILVHPDRGGGHTAEFQRRWAAYEAALAAFMAQWKRKPPP